jgi:hypothetical protein
MRRFFRDKKLHGQSHKYSPKKALFKNWERDIRTVDLEPCEHTYDSSGYKAVFYLTPEAAEAASFTVGASLLQQRRDQIEKAGYKAPMTSKALFMAGRAQKQPEEA